jgi:DNA-directed RNA polymerase specialized sigma subunit
MSELVPSGTLFETEAELIEQVAKAKAHQYKRIGYYDAEDLKQEVRIKCWKAIEKYDSSCGASLFVFLSICADNRLRDIRRSIMYKHNKPCFRCPFWQKEASENGCHDCRVYTDKMQCEKFAKHERYVQAKLSANQPIDIETQKVSDGDYDSYQQRFEMIELIESRLPANLLPLFHKFKAQNFSLKALKAQEKTLLIGVLREMVNEADFQ